MSRNYSNYSNALIKLSNIFGLLFYVENNEDLNKIYFCFKVKKSNDQFTKINSENFENYKANADISLIENDYKKVLSKINDMTRKK
jgi:SET domain-containing protein